MYFIVGITFKNNVIYNNKHFELNISINKYSWTYKLCFGFIIHIYPVVQVIF